MSVSATSLSSMDSVHIAREQTRDAELSIKDFFLKEHPDGETEFAVTMSMDRVDLMKMTQDFLVTSF